MLRWILHVSGVVGMPEYSSTNAARGRRKAGLFAAIAAVLAIALAIALIMWPRRARAPMLVSSYGQSFHNLTFNISSTGKIDGLHRDGAGAWVGTMTIRSPLYGTGPIRGVLSGRTFTYSSASRGEFTAQLADDGALTGTYTYAAGTSSGQKGTWSAKPVGFRRGHTGLPMWLWFVVAGLAGVAAITSAWSWRSRRS
jgi:hypothetical protein